MEADPLSLPVNGATTSVPVTTADAMGTRALRQAQAGDAGAFRELVRTHQAGVYSLALRLLGVREDAQELAQDVFLLLHRHLPGIASVSHLRFWLRRTVCHRAIDRLRRRPRLADLPLEAAALLQAPVLEADPLVDRRLRELLMLLPPMPRAALLLRYQEDLDPPEIARALGLPVNTVKSHLRRSLALLRGRWPQGRCND
jgi:RNA polymerase sigma-70 factor (ECF subfamily)